MSRFRMSTLVLLMWGLAWVATAEPREIHARGVEAIEQKRWQDAVRFFSAAIAERSEERAPLIGRRYLPHYYLGVALAELGDCRGALDSWAETERQGKIRRAEELAAALAGRKQACRDHLRQVEEAQAEVGDILRQADGTAPTLESLTQRPALAPIWSSGDGSFAQRVTAAQQRLDTARQRLEEGGDRSDLETLGEAKDLASQSLTELRAVISDARRQLGELNAAAESALQDLATVEAEALEAVRKVSDLEPFPPRLGGRVADVQRSLQKIEERRDAALAEELEELGVELRETIESLQSAAVRPPRTLVRAVQAFLDGNFEEVLELLADTPYSRGRSAIHACHLEAASRHALYILGGEIQDEVLDLARQGAVACHELAPSFAISRKYFSPRYVEFFDETVNPPSEEILSEEPPTSENDDPDATPTSETEEASS